jgi:ubiquinone/menaquinone biosynthesis C-methylase UbiE
LKKETNNRKFWDRYARFYDAEVLRFSRLAYAQMYARISQALSAEMKVLEIATGTGLIALNIAPYVHSVEATDFSPKMIETAQRKDGPKNVHFSLEDATSLTFNDHAFDAVIISIALHIMPDPGMVLAEIKRVLKPGGLLIAPTFSHGHLRGSASKFSAAILKLVGFETHSAWQPEEYAAFIEAQGFTVQSWCVLKAAFPLVYLEAAAP